MGKDNPVEVASIITVEDINAYYEANPWPLGSIDAVMPLAVTRKDTWKTISNKIYELNEAADPISSKAPVPVAGRQGFKTILGGFAEFGKGREMTADDLEEFENLKIAFEETNNPADAAALVDYYGNDLKFVRNAVQAERIYLSYALLSNACNISLVQANSPYLQSLEAMDYAVESWQKDAVSTSWANAAALILDDIQSAIDATEAQGKVLRKIKINKTWFKHVRNNTQIQKYCATLVQNLYSTQAPPSLNAVNTMITEYFGQDIAFEVIDEKITRSAIDDTKTTANPFADGVAVFTVTTQVGRFVWKKIPIIDPTKETYESFFLAGNVKKVDPSYGKIYSKAKGFPVIDTYADNFYLKIDAVAWS